MRSAVLTTSLFLLFGAASTLTAQRQPTARAELIDPQGERIGSATLRQTPNSGVVIRWSVSGLPPGVHALHIHETGRCDPPSFESAGGHYAPRERAHGFLHRDGAHAGDLSNIYVPGSGELLGEQLTAHVTLREDEPGTLFDDDGSAVVVHAGQDDYASQPAGDAGPRIACGVIRPMSR